MTQDAVCKIRIKRVGMAIKIVPVKPVLKIIGPSLKFRKSELIPLTFWRLVTIWTRVRGICFQLQSVRHILKKRTFIFFKRYSGHCRLLSSWIKGFFFIQNLSDLFHYSLQVKGVIIVAVDTSFSLKSRVLLFKCLPFMVS